MSQLRPGPLNLISDVQGIAVGHAADPTIGAGSTVILPNEPVIVGIDVRGGAPGTAKVHLQDPTALESAADAIVFSGGSLFGLGAMVGVTSELAMAGKGGAVRGKIVPRVPSAILFDLMQHKREDWISDPPYERLGREAYKSATKAFALGSVGAGTGAMAGPVKGGIGSASITDGRIVIGALAAVNSFGSPYLPGSEDFWAAAFEIGDEFGGRAPSASSVTDSDMPLPRILSEQNTTLCAVATNVTLSRAQARRVAMMAQDGLARAIRPVHAPFDGDVVIAMSTGEIELADQMELARIGHLAADCLTRAIARGVYEAR